MATAEPHERGEEAARVVLKHLRLMTPDATARFFDLAEGSSVALLPQVGKELQVALRDVDARDAQAAMVARMACASSEARKLAAAALPAPTRASRHAKVKAMLDLVSTACGASLFDEPGVEAALVALCAADAQPPAVAGGDEVAAWHACAKAAAGSLDAVPDAALASFVCFLGAAVDNPVGHLPALEDPLQIESNCRVWRAERFLAALSG